MKNESGIMRFLRERGFESLAWSLRRLHCPVTSADLVLEVGSGGNPYFRSNVLLDAYEVTRERHYENLITDRPTVIGFVENLPFVDKAFDFVIASHVLEHSSDPVAFITELQRVAKAGYIEVPDAFMERINPYLDHRLEITERGDMLHIRKKPAYQVDPELVELYTYKANSVIAGETMRRHPFHFHVRYYWEENINYKILNNDVDASWPPPKTENFKPTLSIRASFNKLTLGIVRKLFSQNKRNKNIDLRSLLRCPSCGSSDLHSNAHIKCNDCETIYPILNGIRNMTVPEL